MAERQAAIDEGGASHARALSPEDTGAGRALASDVARAAGVAAEVQDIAALSRRASAKRSYDELAKDTATRTVDGKEMAALWRRSEALASRTRRKSAGRRRSISPRGLRLPLPDELRSARPRGLASGAAARASRSLGSCRARRRTGAGASCGIGNRRPPARGPSRVEPAAEDVALVDGASAYRRRASQRRRGKCSRRWRFASAELARVRSLEPVSWRSGPTPRSRRRA